MKISQYGIKDCSETGEGIGVAYQAIVFATVINCYSRYFYTTIVFKDVDFHDQVFLLVKTTVLDIVIGVNF